MPIPHIPSKLGGVLRYSAIVEMVITHDPVSPVFSVPGRVVAGYGGTLLSA